MIKKSLKTLNINQSSMKKMIMKDYDLAINMLIVSFVRTIWSMGEGDGINGDIYGEKFIGKGEDISCWLTRTEMPDGQLYDAAVLF